MLKQIMLKWSAKSSCFHQQIQTIRKGSKDILNVRCTIHVMGAIEHEEEEKICFKKHKVQALAQAFYMVRIWHNSFP